VVSRIKGKFARRSIEMTNSTTNNTIQVALVGGRQAPNVIGALVLRPSRVELVASADESDKKTPVLLDSLKGIESLSLPTQEEVKVVDAYSFEGTVAACRQVCERYPNHIIDFNLTGSTKVMAIAAYEVARQYDNARAFYVDTGNSRILWLEGKGQKGSTSFELTIKQYLQTYGRQPEPIFDFRILSLTKSQSLEAAQLLAETSPDSGRFLLKIKQKQGSGPRQVTYKSPNSQEQDLIDRLIKIGVVDSSESHSFTIRSNEDWNFFTGGWIELYVWSEAKKQTDLKGNPFFPECELSLEIPSPTAKREIDVACLYQAQLIHSSCKTDRRPFDAAYLDELRAVSSLVGGRFCSRVFITNGTFRDKDQEERFMAQAKQHEIVVVTGDKLSNVGEILKKQAVRPDYRRI
jgi:hypothetical protein